MDWKNMFETDDIKKENQSYSNMFGTPTTPKPSNDAEPLYKDMFGNAPTKQESAIPKSLESLFSEMKKTVPTVPTVKTDWSTVNNALSTPFERDVRTIDSTANVVLVEKWVKQWDNTFTKMSSDLEQMSHRMLDLTQDLSRTHELQDTVFNSIQDGIRVVDQAFNPSDVNGFFSIFKNKPETLSNSKINEIVNDVQRTLMNLKIDIDPFITNSLEQMRFDIDSITRYIEASSIALEYQLRFGNKDQDFYDRQVIRLHNLKTILSLSDAGITQLSKQISSRTMQLNDFKSQAVPMVVIKMQNYIINKDSAVLKGAFVDILQMKLG